MTNTQDTNVKDSDLEIEIDQDLYDKLSKIALSQNTTVECVVENFLKQYIDNIEKNHEHQK